MRYISLLVSSKMQHFKKQILINCKPSSFMLFKSGQFKPKVYFKSYLVEDSEDQQIIKDRTPYISDIDVRAPIYREHERYIDFINNNRNELVSIENFDYEVLSFVKVPVFMSIIYGGVGVMETGSFVSGIILMSFPVIVMGFFLTPIFFFRRRNIQQYINYRNLSSKDFLKAVKKSSVKK